MCVHMESVKTISKRQGRPTSIRAKGPSPYRMDSNEEIASEYIDCVIIRSDDNDTESNQSDILAGPINISREG